tara:strand:+ start:6202 stop:7107 length:906 start_codon:yes stop_codon:yes gene_type:complete
MQIKIKNTTFSCPILSASGTYGYGHEVSDIVDLNDWGGIITKSVTRYPREGNPPPRIVETSAGMLNSIGLANIGVKQYCKTIIPFIKKLNTNIIINIAGSTIDEYIETLQILEKTDSDHVGYEINISCPNVKEGGMSFGNNAKMTENLTRELRKNTNRLLIMKLSPNVTNIEDIALSAEGAGADAVSAINTLVGMSIDINSRKSKIFTKYGGLSGPAIKPVAIASVHKIYKVLKIPIIGIGGITCLEDIIEFLLAGATMIEIGTMNYQNPDIGPQLKTELSDYLKNNNIKNIKEIVGKVDL